MQVLKKDIYEFLTGKRLGEDLDLEGPEKNLKLQVFCSKCCMGVQEPVVFEETYSNLVKLRGFLSLSSSIYFIIDGLHYVNIYTYQQTSSLLLIL